MELFVMLRYSPTRRHSLVSIGKEPAHSREIAGTQLSYYCHTVHSLSVAPHSLAETAHSPDFGTGSAPHSPDSRWQSEIWR